jgi:hypothetical protein
MSFATLRKEPTLFQVGTYWLMRILGILGIASIVEGARIWVGFLREIVALYASWIREPLYNVLLSIWPASWSTPSLLAVDLAMIWTSFFAAANYHIIREEGRSIVGHIYTNENNLIRSRPLVVVRTAIKVSIIFLIGPVLYPLLAINIYRRGEQRDSVVITDWVVIKPYEVLKYVLQQLAVVIILLFISYQMQQQGVL